MGSTTLELRGISAMPLAFSRCHCHPLYGGHIINLGKTNCGFIRHDHADRLVHRDTVSDT